MDYNDEFLMLERRVNDKLEESKDFTIFLRFSGKQLFEYEYDLTKIRHDIICNIVASRLQISPNETTVRESLEVIANRPLANECGNEPIYRKTPDLFRYSISQDDNRRSCKLHWYEITMSNDYQTANARKNVKYKELKNKVVKFVRDNILQNTHIDVYLTTLVFNSNLSNFGSELRKCGVGSRNPELEDKSYLLIRKINNLLQDIKKIVERLSPESLNSYNIEKSLHHKIEDSEGFLPTVEFDYEEMHKVMDNLEDTIPRFDFNYLEGDLNPDSILKRLSFAIKHIHKTFDSGFKPPNAKNFKESENVVLSKLKNFGKIEVEDKSPTFHFMYCENDYDLTEKYRSFEERFFRACDIINKLTRSKSKEYHFLKNIFKKENLETNESTDKSVFFADTTFKNWPKVKKKLKNVLQPKTFSTKVLSKDGKQYLELAGVKLKKVYIKERKEKEYRDERMKMKTLQWWNKEDMKMMEDEVNKKSKWFCKKSKYFIDLKENGKIKEEKSFRDLGNNFDKDTQLNEYYEMVQDSNLHEFVNYIKNVSRNIIFRSNTCSKGLEIMSTGNPNVFFISLPGGDVTQDDGSIRFMQFVIVETSKYLEKKIEVFNEELTSIKFMTRDNKYTLFVSRWLSINRARWEHVNKINPMPFIALQLNRAKVKTLFDFKRMVFFYTYAAYGCQSKISGIIDNFRYLIPGATADYSGLCQYIEDKLIIPVKTSGQALLLKLCFETLNIYTEQRKNIKKDSIQIVDEELDVENSMLKYEISSIFEKKIIWKERSHSLSEVFLFFFMTGKGFHEVNYRDVTFVKDIIGGEVEFKEEIESKFRESEILYGIPLSNADELLETKRGGLFCRETMQYASIKAFAPVSFDQNWFFEKLALEKLNDNILSNNLLSSTRSSLLDIEYNDGKFIEKKFTLLENSLKYVQDYNPEAQEYIRKVITDHMSCLLEAFNKMSNVEHQGLTNDIDSVTNSSTTEANDSDSELDNGDEEEFEKDDISRNYQIKLKKLRNVNLNDFAAEKIIQTIDDPDQKKEAESIREFYKKMSLDTIDKKEQRIREFLVGVFETDKRIVLTEKIYNELIEVYKEMLNERGIPDLDTSAKYIDDTYGMKSHRFLKKGALRSTSPLYFALEFLSERAVYGTVAKHQRTQKDREIFIQNKARYQTYIEEHVHKVICKKLNVEAITEPGDEKMLKLQNLFKSAEKWKSLSRTINVGGIKVKIERQVKYFTGDMSKFSNHDTHYRLNFMWNCAKKMLPKKIYELIAVFYRNHTRKQVILPSTLKNKKLDSEDPIMEWFKKCKSDYPVCNIKQNWLQGMRNYAASVAHAGTALLISDFITSLDENTYYDSMVHSDDWVAVFGYEIWTPEMKENYHDYYPKYYETYDLDHKYIESFFIKVIVIIYKLNNLNVSIKKSSISSKFVEFVSYVMNGGNSCMVGEKQLISIFSEKTGLGIREDMISLISQASNAVFKGVASNTVDLFVKVAISDLRDEYSMKSGQRLDPCSYFETTRDLMPLCLLPNLKKTILFSVVSEPSFYDHELIEYLYHNYVTLGKKHVKEIEEAAKLIACLSIFHLGENSTFTSEINELSEDSLIPGLIFKPKNLNDIRNKRPLNNQFTETEVKFPLSLDPTVKIIAPKDLMYSILNSHYKLKSPSVLYSLTTRNRIVMMRSRTEMKYNKCSKFNSVNEYFSVDENFKFLKKEMDGMSSAKTEEILRNLYKLIETTTNTKKTVSKWLTSCEIEKTNFRTNNSKTLMRLPLTTKDIKLSNRSTVVIVKTVNEERFKLNNMFVKFPNLINEDIEKMSEILEKIGYYKAKTPMQKAKMLEIIKSYTPDFIKGNLILTSPRRILKDIDVGLNWVFERNVLEGIKTSVKSSHILKIDVSIATNRERHNQKLYNEIAVMSEVYKFQTITNSKTVSANELKLFKKDNSSILKMVSEDIELAKEILTTMPYKYKNALTMLEFVYLNSTEILNRTSLRQPTFIYSDYDKKEWKRDEPSRNMKLEIIYGSYYLKLVFNENSEITLYCDVDNFNAMKNLLYAYYNKCKRYYNFDKYRYPTYNENISNNQKFMVGRFGNYSLRNKSDLLDYRGEAIALVVHEKRNTTEIELTKPKIDGLNLVRDGAIVASVDNTFEYVNYDQFEIESKGILKINEMFNDQIMRSYSLGEIRVMPRLIKKYSFMNEELKKKMYKREFDEFFMKINYAFDYNFSKLIKRLNSYMRGRFRFRIEFNEFNLNEAKFSEFCIDELPVSTNTDFDFSSEDSESVYSGSAIESGTRSSAESNQDALSLKSSDNEGNSNSDSDSYVYERVDKDYEEGSDGSSDYERVDQDYKEEHFDKDSDSEATVADENKDESSDDEYIPLTRPKVINGDTLCYVSQNEKVKITETENQKIFKFKTSGINYDMQNLFKWMINCEIGQDINKYPLYQLIAICITSFSSRTKVEIDFENIELSKLCKATMLFKMIYSHPEFEVVCIEIIDDALDKAERVKKEESTYSSDLMTIFDSLSSLFK